MKSDSISRRPSLVGILTAALAFFILFGCASKELKRRGWETDPDLRSQCIDLLRHHRNAPEELARLLSERTRAFQSLVEEQLIIRQKSAGLAMDVMAADPAAPLPPAELDAIKQQMSRGLAVNRRVFDNVTANECWWPEVENSRTPREKELRLKGAMLALAGSLVLYDTYLLNLSVATEDDRIRRFMDQSDLGYGVDAGQLSALSAFYEDVGNRLVVHRMIGTYQTHRPGVSPEFARQREFRYLEMLIEQSPSYEILRSQPVISKEVVSSSLDNRAVEISDHISKLKRNATGGLSRIFGNGIGMVESRKGKLYDDTTVRAKALKALRPGDILLEKTPFRLTDTFIPGHWGHAAIWVGTEAELKALGIWEHPVVKKHQAAIREGRMVAEALRDGVQLNTLEHFMNIDDMGVLRQPGLKPARRAELVVQALRQIGKAYDFNFDVETTDEIVCSELVYQVYTHIRWPTDKMAGRYTISPDNVAWKALDGGPLQTVMFYHDGREVTGDRGAVMRRLMETSDQDENRAGSTEKG